MPHSDVLSECSNVCYHVRHPYPVLGLTRENSANKWLEMVFTDGSYQAIIRRNAVLEITQTQTCLILQVIISL